MSTNDVKQVSNASGTVRALQLKADAVAPDGKAASEAGKKSPVAAMEKPDLERLASKLNIASRTIGRDLRFRIDMNSGRSVIQVLDRDTGEIIREIPPEKARLTRAGDGNMQIRLYDELA